MPERYMSIEELKRSNETPDAVFEGVKAANGWRKGKKTTDKEYQEAVEAFKNAPMDGREVKRDV